MGKSNKMSRSLEQEYFKKIVQSLSTRDLDNLYYQKLVDFDESSFDYYESKKPKLFQIFFNYLTKLEHFFNCKNTCLTTCALIEKMNLESSIFKSILFKNYSKVQSFIIFYINLIILMSD